ncbi:glycosyltransferase [Candidatus Roizmanbacteria bacterium]|nr:MAG: glycosyltransferase [Candidatus Roizmanbacteria bacterium]
MKPEISIIIAVRNAEQFIKTCIDSLLAEKTENYEIIAVDDASDDDTGKILKTYERRKMITLYTFQSKKGAAAARNYAVRKSSGTYLFFLDSDTEIQPGWGETVPQLYKTNSNAIMLCKLLRFHSNRFDSAGELLTPFYLLIDRAKAAINTGQFEKEAFVFSGKSAAMIIPKKQFERIGGFDEKMEWLVEDTDLCFRNWLAGYTVLYQPAITVFHNDPTYEKTKKYYSMLQPKYRGCRNTIRSVIKNVEGKRLWYALPVQVGIWIVLAVIILLRFDLRAGGELVQGILWNFMNITDTLRERKKIQRLRIISDEDLLKKVGNSEPITHYLDKAIRYVKG